MFKKHAEQCEIYSGNTFNSLTLKYIFYVDGIKISEPIIRNVKTMLCVIFFSTRGLLMERDFHFGVFLPESVRRILVGGYSSDFVSFHY
jgi:hypothetical protein